MRVSVASFGWALVAVALAVTAYSCWSVPAAPLGPIETTYRLQAESLARDRDLVYEEEDRRRFADRAWPDREARVLVALDGERLRYERPWPYALALAPFVRLAPERGPYVLNLLVLGALTLLLGARLRRHGPRGGAPYWTAALLFGTPVFATSRAVWPELLVGALLAVAYLLTRDQAPPAEPPQMARPRSRPAAVALRWLAVGALAACAAVHEPLLAVFFLAFLGLALRSRDETAWASAIGGFALVLAGTWFFGGSLFAGVSPWSAEASLGVRGGDSIRDVTEWTRRLASVEAPEFVVDLRLWLWNGVYTLAGRHVGVLAGFAPLVVLAAAGSGRRSAAWAPAAAVAVLALILDPFNFFGGPEALANRRLMPALIVCCFAVRPPAALWPAALAASMGAVAVAPLWLDPATPPRLARDRVVPAAIAERLPFETSQRHVPVSGEVVSRRMLVRPADAGIRPAAGKAQFVLSGERGGKLMVATDGPGARFDLEFGEGAATELELAGGFVEDLLFRPDGGVTFRVRVDDALIRHRLWGREGIYEIHMLKLAMPGPGDPGRSFSVGVPGGP